MICETCKAEGKTSRVYDRGGSTTSAYYEPFYDESGKRHNHDGNITTTGFECSNGHRWTVESTGSCWCGWPNKREPETASAITRATSLAMPTAGGYEGAILVLTPQRDGNVTLGWQPATDAVPRADESTTFGLTLPKNMLAALIEFAGRAGVGLDVLINRWLDDRIRQEALSITTKERP